MATIQRARLDLGYTAQRFTVAQQRRAPAAAAQASRGDELAAVREAFAKLDRLMTRLLEVWQRLRNNLGDPAALAEMVAAFDELGAEELAPPPTATPRAPAPALAAPTPTNDANAQLAQQYVQLSLQVKATYARDAEKLQSHTQDGITVVDAKTLRTDRYEIRFEDADTLRITDLESGQFTRVWGDPHVDLSTVDGELNGEFSDLKRSENVTTFVLKDGTRVRFLAPDAGLIQQVDVVRGDAAVRGTGVTVENYGVGVFHSMGSPSNVPSDHGDVVIAGDDGATWYDATGKLIWGAGKGSREVNREAGRATVTRVHEGDDLERPRADAPVLRAPDL